MTSNNENSSAAPSSDAATKGPATKVPSPADNQPTATSNTRANSSKKKNSDGRGDGRDSKIVLSNPVGYEGDTPAVGAVLALKHERFHKKVPFSQFVEKVYGYVLSNFKDGGDMKPIFKDFKDPLATLQANHMPRAIENPSEIEKEIQRERIKQYVSREVNVRRNRERAFGIVWGQCSLALQSEMKGNHNYEEKSASFDILWLLVELKKAVSGIDDKVNPYLTLHEAISTLYKMKQGQTESNEHYLERFKANVNTVELAKGDHIFCSDELLLRAYGDKPSDTEIEAEKDRSKAVLLLKNSDDRRFGGLAQRLREGSYVSRDEYPKTVAGMYELMVKHAGHVANEQGQAGKRAGMMFAQKNLEEKSSGRTLVAGNDGKIHNVECYNCRSFGHYASQCPEVSMTKNTGVDLLNKGVLFVQPTRADDAIINKDWILLDTCSTDNVCNNKALVSKIRKCEDNESLEIRTNGGSIVYNYIAELKILPLKIFFNKSSIANILSLKHVAAIPGVYVTMDTRKEKSMVVHLPGGNKIKFLEYVDGLYYHDTSKNNDEVNPCPSSTNKNISLLSTVDQNKSIFSKKQIKAANLARNFQQCMGWPSDKAFKQYITNNLVNNLTISSDDIDRATCIYGKAEPLLQGKMVAPTQHRNHSVQVPLLNTLTDQQKRIQLYIDIFFVNGIAFLHTKSKPLNFITIRKLTNRKTKTILKVLGPVITKYLTRGFTITDVYGDNEFDGEDYKTIILPARMHICATGEHVPIIERSIRTIKERCRSTCHGLPFKRYPKLMVTGLLEHVEFWLNAFPSDSAEIKNVSPSTLVTGSPQPNFNKKRVPFGSYVMAYKGTKNDMSARAIPAIALRESNDFGGFYFLSLETGNRFHSKKWDVLPISSQTIDKVHQLADNDDQPVMNENLFVFETAPGEIIHFNAQDGDDESCQNEDESLSIQDEGDAQTMARLALENNHALISAEESDNVIFNDELEDEDEDEFRNSDELDSNTITSDDYSFNIQNTLENDHEHENVYTEDTSQPDDVTIESAETSHEDEVAIESHDEASCEDNAHTESPDSANDQVTESENVSDEVIAERLQREYNQQVGLGTPPDEAIANVRPRRENSGAGVDRLEMSFKGAGYGTKRSKCFLTERTNDYSDLRDRVMGIVFTQMSANQGIKKHGDKAVAAVFKELQQLDTGVLPGNPVVAPQDPTELTAKDMREALEAVNLIKEKRNGELKGRTCVNGARQRKYLKDEENISSPTASLEAIFTTLVIDAIEERDVAVVDVPGAYLHAEWPAGKRVLLKLVGKFVDIMCQVNPKYEPYVRTELRNGKKTKVLYLKVLRALYGALESALLWYELYSGVLQKMGFVLNPYDKCVANKTINGSQCTIVFYVDDNKISHRDPEVVSQVIREIETYFGKLKVNRGNKHDYLGMNIVFKDGKVEVEMKDQIREAIQWYGELSNAKPPTPAAKHLFMTNENAEVLEASVSEKFHSVVAKLLYISKRARPDIEPTVAFLCTRVSCPDVDDWKKLGRLLSYLKNTIDDKRIIGASSLENLLTWVDAAYAVYKDMRSQTGGAISLGHGVVQGRSSKQKINTKSSTEAELVGVSEFLPYNIWLTNFMKEQGCTIKNNTLFQDNTSAIRLENNGRNSCTGNSRHIDVRYFFVADRVKNGEITIKYCPTNKMLADFFTKPLQGTLFKFFKDIIMGYVPIQQFIVGTNEIKEHVENPKKCNKQERNLICVGPTSIKKDHNKHQQGPVLHVLGPGSNEKAEYTKATNPSNSGTNKPTYASIVKNSQ